MYEVVVVVVVGGGGSSGDGGKDDVEDEDAKKDEMEDGCKKAHAFPIDRAIKSRAIAPLPVRMILIVKSGDVV